MAVLFANFKHRCGLHGFELPVRFRNEILARNQSWIRTDCSFTFLFKIRGIDTLWDIRSRAQNKPNPQAATDDVRRAPALHSAYHGESDAKYDAYGVRRLGAARFR